MSEKGAQLIAAEMVEGTVYHHEEHGLIVPVQWHARSDEVILRDTLDGGETNSRSGRVLAVCLSRSKPEKVGCLLLVDPTDTVRKAFGLY